MKKNDSKGKFSVWTPRQYRTGKRLEFKAEDVKFLDGTHPFGMFFPRGVARVEIAGKVYKVRRASCGLGCKCDVLIYGYKVPCYRCPLPSVTVFADSRGVVRDCCSKHAEALSMKTLKRVL